MSLSDVASTLGCLLCVQCAYASAAPGSESQQIIPAPDAHPNSFRALQDSQQVDSWIILSHPALQDNSVYADVFAHYEKRSFNNLRKPHQDHVMSIIYQTIDCREMKKETVSLELGKIPGWHQAMQIAEYYTKANPECKYTGQFSTHSIEFTRPVASEMEIIAERSWIWKHSRFGYYVISCSQTADSAETFFVIGAQKNVLWTSRNNRRDEPPDPSATFPLLIINNQKVVDGNDSIYELHANYKAMVLENRKLIQSNHGVNWVNNELKSNNQELTEDLARFRSENQKLENRITALNGEQRGMALNQRMMDELLRTEQDAHHSLKETHHQMMIGCVVGLGLMVLLLLLIVIVLYRWKRRYRINSASGPECISAVEAQEVPGVIRNYRPRSRTIDELHHKFGMNEVDQVTPQEGSDLVRIARPLETAGAERKLSEELLGIEPIISDGNGGTKQTDTTGTKNGSEGEEGASPREAGPVRRISSEEHV